DARIAEVALVVDLDVVRRVERLVLEAGDGREQLALPLRLRVVELALPLRRPVRAGARVFCRGHLAADSTVAPLAGSPAGKALCRYVACEPVRGSCHLCRRRPPGRCRRV